MKCCCHIHKEMNSAASSIWAASVVAFVFIFYVVDKSFTLNNVIYWWATAVTLRLMAVETVRTVMLKDYYAVRIIRWVRNDKRHH